MKRLGDVGVTQRARVEELRKQAQGNCGICTGAGHCEVGSYKVGRGDMRLRRHIEVQVCRQRGMVVILWPLEIFFFRLFVSVSLFCRE